MAVEKILKQDRQMVNIVSRQGQSALHLGMQFPAVIQTLVCRHHHHNHCHHQGHYQLHCPACDINIADPQGRTLLHAAAARLDTGLVRSLVEAGAGVTCQDMLGECHNFILKVLIRKVRCVTSCMYIVTMYICILYYCIFVYIAGNTPAHLVLLEGVEISAADCLYISGLEGMVDTNLLETIASAEYLSA